MNETNTEDGDRNHIKITEGVFVYGGLFLGVMGAIFIFLPRGFNFGPSLVVSGAILVGIGALAGCILKIYDRLRLLEQKLNNLGQSTNTTE